MPDPFRSDESASADDRQDGVVLISAALVAGPAQFLTPDLWWLGDAPGVGARLSGAWQLAGGAGVSVGVLDSGINRSHAEIAGSYDASRGFHEGPAPGELTDSHGTQVAGLITGRADNGIAGIGAAPDATVTATYITFGTALDPGHVAGLLAGQAAFDVSNNSWGFLRAFDDNFLTPSVAPVGQALAEAVETGRGGLGTVMVFAGGNGRLMVDGRNIGDDANFHNLPNARQTIAVGATDATGAVAFYSSPGANLLLAAPGTGLVTATGTGEGATDAAWVSGTSFAAPMVSGVVALMLEANPALGYRDVQDILALTARPLAPGAGSGSVENTARGANGGGLLFDRDRGFGLLDAEAAVRLARSWTQVQTAANEVSATLDFGFAFAADPLHHSFTATMPVLPGTMRVQQVDLTLTLADSALRDLRIDLVSPSGTAVTLAPSLHAAGNRSNLSFTFASVATWGEDPSGDWTLQLSHPEASPRFAVYAARLTAWGSADGPDDLHVFTPTFAALAADDPARRTIFNADGGQDTLNFAAAAGPVTLALGQDAGTLDGMALHLAGAFGAAIGSAFADRLAGSAGADSLLGDDGPDTLSGWGGDDVLSGGAGADALWGGAGNDRLEGGDGADRVAAGPGDDTLSGGPGIDAMVLFGASGGVSVDLLAQGTPQAIGGGEGVDLFDGFENVLGSAAGRDTLLGDDGPNFLRAFAGDDRLEGRAGNDTLAGGSGDDLLLGGAGADRLHGAHGNDTLDGGAGPDWLSGGAGADVFRFAEASDSGFTTRDTITDFVSGLDRIDLQSIDGDPATPGRQALSFGSADAGGLAFVTDGRDGWLLGLIEDAGPPDLVIVLRGVTAIGAEDLLL
jgi:subtilisin-like proprotein convertase family protein